VLTAAAILAIFRLRLPLTALLLSAAAAGIAWRLLVF